MPDPVVRAPAGLQTVLSRSVSLTAADILALESIPFVLVASPGASLAALPLAYFLRTTYGTAVYTGNVPLYSSVGGASFGYNLNGADGDAGILAQPADVYAFAGNSVPTVGGSALPFVSSLIAQLENQAILLSSDGAFGDGDGGLTVCTFYVLVNI